MRETRNVKGIWAHPKVTRDDVELRTSLTHRPLPLHFMCVPTCHVSSILPSISWTDAVDNPIKVAPSPRRKANLNFHKHDYMQLRTTPLVHGAPTNTITSRRVSSTPPLVAYTLPPDEPRATTYPTARAPHQHDHFQVSVIHPTARHLCTNQHVCLCGQHNWMSTVHPTARRSRAFGSAPPFPRMNHVQLRTTPLVHPTSMIASRRVSSTPPLVVYALTSMPNCAPHPHCS